jgi:hypothetical protein
MRSAAAIGINTGINELVNWDNGFVIITSQDVFIRANSETATLSTTSNQTQQ